MRMPRHRELLSQNPLHAANLPVPQADFDAVRMRGRGRQNLGDKAAGEFAGPLVLFERHLDLHSLPNVISSMWIHKFLRQHPNILKYVGMLFYVRWNDLRKLTKVLPYGDKECSTNLPRYFLLISPA